MRSFVLTVSLLVLVFPAAASHASEWNFDVFLDDKRVGTHQFAVERSEAQQRVQSVAAFKVKFLFFSAYSYQHTNIESWADDCLLSFDAKTNVNGEPTRVSGSTADAGFVVEKRDTKELLPECVMSFAYWNPVFLQQERLLNPQTGEYLDVKVELIGTESKLVQGEMVAAQRYKITARNIDLDVWYTEDQRWVGLKSIAKTGHIIRYELS